jgi:hypothetical protein
MHAGQIFSYYAQCEKLCAEKDGNDRGEKWQSRYTSFQAIADEDINKDAKPK